MTFFEESCRATGDDCGSLGPLLSNDDDGGQSLRPLRRAAGVVRARRDEAVRTLRTKNERRPDVLPSLAFGKDRSYESAGEPVVKGDQHR
jgi:hypothetical protein